MFVLQRIPPIKIAGATDTMFKKLVNTLHGASALEEGKEGKRRRSHAKDDQPPPRKTSMYNTESLT